MASIFASLGADAAANTRLLQSIHDAATGGDVILLPASGTYPLQIVAQSAGNYNALKLTKALTIQGSGPLPTSCVLIPEIDATTDAVALNGAFPYLFNLGDNFASGLVNVTIDCQWLMTNNRNAVGGYEASRGTKTITDVLIRNARLSFCTHAGSTLAVTRFVGESIGTSYPAILGGNHGFDCDGHTASGTATTGTIDQIKCTNDIGDAIKFENSNTVTVSKFDFRGRVVMGQNDASSLMAFGEISFSNGDFWGPVTLGDDAAGAAKTGAGARFLGSRFRDQSCVTIFGANQTETAKYGEGGANEIVATGNHFYGRNSIIEYFPSAVPAASGVVYRDAGFAAANYGVRSVPTKYVRATPMPTGSSVSLGPTVPYSSPEFATTSVVVIEAAATAGDEIYYLPGTYTPATSGQFNASLVKACRHVFPPGVVFDGKNTAVARLFAMAPTSGTLSFVGKLAVRDVLTTSGFGGVIDANISAGATVALDDLEIDHVERASGSALYGVAVRTRGAGSFSFNRMAVKNSKSGDTTNGGDGAFFAFEHTAGGLSGGVIEMVDNEDRGTDARSGLVSFKLGANTFDISAMLALRNTRPTTAGGRALVFNNSTSGGTIRHLTSSGNAGSAGAVNCINNGAASGAITVSGFIVKADSQGNTRTGTATVTFSNGIYEVAAAAEAGVSNSNVVTTTTELLPDGRVKDAASVAYNRDSTIGSMNWWTTGNRPRSAGAPFRDRGIHLGAIQ